MKRVLIISPHFPPVNAPDMQRIRMCLPYYRDYNWEPVVLCVDQNYVDGYLDNLLTDSYPKDIEIHKVKAFSTKLTRKFGVGSLSLRSYFQIMKKGNQILKNNKFDLIFFSTTAFHVFRIGPYWKKKFGVPYVLDIQDPWRNDFYLNQPKDKRPPKFKINYLIDKYLEAACLPKADGIISVSNGYIEILKNRYSSLTENKFLLLPFCISQLDFEIAKKVNTLQSSKYAIDPNNFNIIYIGRGGFDLKVSIEILFEAFNQLIKENPLTYNKVRFIFAGTSYAPVGKGIQTIKPMAEKMGIDKFVVEITDRLPYFEALSILQNANLLFVPGSTDASYTASKIFPYILAKKPIFAIFHKSSSVVSIIKKSQSGLVIEFDENSNKQLCIEQAVEILDQFVEKNKTFNEIDSSYMETHSANYNTKMQIEFFNKIIEKSIK